MPGSPSRSPRRVASPKKTKKRVAKPTMPAAHPTYNAMICAAINSLKERRGSSRQAILKYILANYKGITGANVHLRLALRRGVQSKSLRQTKGSGASGKFRVGEVKKAIVKKPKRKAAKKAKKPKKRATKPKAKPKKTAKPKAKKAAAKKSTKARPAKKVVTTKSKAKRPTLATKAKLSKAKK